MEYLIHLIARAISAHLERGSPRGALIGAIVGAFVAAETTFILAGTDAIQSPWAVLIPLTLVAAFAGAMIGAMFRRTAPPIDLARSGSVRITRLNKGLVPLFFVLVFGILGVVALAYPGKDQADAGWIAAILFTLSGISFLVLGFSILWIDFGPQIVVFRLFRRSHYSLADVASAGFEHQRRGSYSLTHPSSQFAIRFVDGFSITVEVPPHKAPVLARLFIDAGLKEA